MEGECFSSTAVFGSHLCIRATEPHTPASQKVSELLLDQENYTIVMERGIQREEG